ncbi:MAG: DNA polymerase IV [Candidatus Cloacimonetes bacterium]|nr:DNA polymerase IV [Candidatus Cloacimonadota bacterium]
MERIILHLDMDAFFAAIEQRDNPKLIGKPVVVGGDEGNKGVVSTASYEAREYGIHSAMPISEAKKLCPNAFYLRGNFKKYIKDSISLVEICQSISPIIQPTSIDELFIDISGSIPFFNSKREIAETLQKVVWKKLHLTCSIGIAPNKLLAKITSEVKKPSGITILEKENIEKFLGNLSIEKVAGIGEKTTKILKNLGIHTVGNLNKYPESILVKKFGKFGKHLAQIGKGIDDSPVIPISKKPKPKSIGNEITFSESTRNKDQLRKMLLELTNKTAYRLRKKNAVAFTITLKIKYDNFVVKTFSQTLDKPINYDSEIYKIISGMLDKMNFGFHKVRLLGIRLTNLKFSNDPIQLSIFSIYEEKFANISKAVDKLRQKFGESIIDIGK